MEDEVVPAGVLPHIPHPVPHIPHTPAVEALHLPALSSEENSNVLPLDLPQGIELEASGRDTGVTKVVPTWKVQDEEGTLWYTTDDPEANPGLTVLEGPIMIARKKGKYDQIISTILATVAPTYNPGGVIRCNKPINVSESADLQSFLNSLNRIMDKQYTVNEFKDRGSWVRVVVSDPDVAGGPKNVYLLFSNNPLARLVIGYKIAPTYSKVNVLKLNLV